MEYRHKSRIPVTAKRRAGRWLQQRSADLREEERNRRRSVAGGQTDELGVTQGQNGEQGNTTHPRNAKPIGRSAH